MYWLDRLFRKEKTEKQLDSELRFHLEQQVADYVKAGMSPEQARRRAQMEFGGLEGVKEECRESRRVQIIDTLIQDVRYGMRMMRKSPGFTIVAVLTLTLGIGANTAIFSVVSGVLLNPLPYPHPDQLVTLHESKPNFERGSVSYPNFRDWQKDNHTFSGMAIYRNYAFSLTGRGDAEQVQSQLISSDFFQLLGVTPVIGRLFAQGEDEIGAAPTVLISAGLWERKFGSAPDALGKSLTLDSRDYTIVGVIPASFDLSVGVFSASDVYVPIGQWSNPLVNHRSAGLGIHGIGRLKPGIRMEQARADMDTLTRNLAAAYPEDNKGISASLVPLRAQIVGDVQPFLIVLFAAVGFVLLIACVNVANLLLARSNRRTREFAVRIALGASKARVMRQLLTESVLLAFAGGALGLGVAAWGTRAMLKTFPATLPRAGEIGINARVLIFSVLVSVLSGILFGLIPALKTSRPDVLARMKEGSQMGRTRHRAQNIFVVTELAMALVLLAGAGLMIRSLTRLWSVDPGFDPHNVLTFGISLPPSMAKASPDQIRAAFRALDDKFASIPEAEATAFSWGAFPMQGDDEDVFWMDGQPKPASPNDMNWTLSYVVGPAYLKAMRIPLLRGRFLDDHDTEHEPLVAVVDDVFAEKFFPGKDPLAARINLDDHIGHALPTQIVGIVKHVKQWGLDSDDKQALRAQIYRPFMQLPDQAMALSPSGTSVVMRSRTATPGLFDSIRSVLHRMNSEYVVYGAQMVDETISSSLSARRYSMILLGAFAVLALVLSSVGIYGVISYVVGQRTHEIGIRMALGARRIHVLRLVLGQGSRLIAVGITVGVAAALALTRLMANLLFGVSATDPLTFLCVVALLMMVALLACGVPARRAMRVDPMRALRYE
jgi:predicted permease